MANRMANDVINRISELYNSIVAKIGESSFFTGLLETAEEHTGIPSAYIATGLSSALLLFIVLGYGPTIMFDLVVVLYPAYMSFNALERRETDTLVYWMKYWIVFGLFRATEHVADSLFWWMPGYLFLKFLFLFWCLAPLEQNGSVIVYENYIREAFYQHQESVDDAIAAVKSLTNIATIQLDQEH